MRTPTILLFLAVVLVNCWSASFGQPQTNEFVSGVARFAIRIDVPFIESESLYNQQGKYYLPGEKFAWADDKSVYLVTHYTPFSPSVTGRDLPLLAKAEILKGARGELLNDFAKNGATAKEIPFVVGTSKGLEFQVSGSRKSFVRLFFVGNRFYILLATSTDESNTDSLRKALDTIRFLARDEYVAAMLREHTPAELPQIIPTGIAPTDAMESGLKRRVNEIIEDVETGTPKARQRSSEAFYNDHGFLTKTISYSAGYPETITNFGWVDGRRSVNVAPISYRGEGIGFGTSKMTVGWGAPEGYNVIGRDQTGQIIDRRYTARFENDYDDEWRIKERRNVSSQGDVNFVEKYTYSVGSREVKIEDDSGGFISRKLEILDKDGNLVEERTLDNLGKANSTMKYEHEFDANGNWIVRRAMVLWKGAGRPGFRHHATYYRTIKYYE